MLHVVSTTQVISHLTCLLPVRPAGHHGNRRDASAGVGYLSHIMSYGDFILIDIKKVDTVFKNILAVSMYPH